MIGIYKIENRVDGKIYIGKSIDIKRRFIQHRYNLTSKKAKTKYYNRYLRSAVDKYGIDSFCFSILELFDTYDDNKLADAEIKWMDYYNSYDSDKGYNLKKDSSTSVNVSSATKKLMSEKRKGVLNSNYGNKWNSDQKKKMSNIKKQQFKSKDNNYNDEWKSKISEASKKLWSDEEKKKKMSERVSKSKQKFNFYKYTKQEELISIYNSVEEILLENPSYKWQNIYAACNGSKKSYMGYIWKKELKI